MKKIFFGFVAALVLVGLAVAGYLFIRGSFAAGPVSPALLNPDAKDFGALRVAVFGKGEPVARVEVDVGEPGGRMSYAVTDAKGVAVFDGISVGAYRIFFNDLNYPKEFERVSAPISVQVLKGETVEKRIDLEPKS